MLFIEAKKDVFCSYKKIFIFFWNIKKWNLFWSPMQKITVVYDDSCHQDFLMHVDWNDNIHQVRTVRFKIGKNIHFFSPIPPPPTIFHHGKWTFSEKSNECIQIKATRWFECPPTMKPSQLKKFSKDFIIRLEKILDKVKHICEN